MLTSHHGPLSARQRNASCLIPNIIGAYWVQARTVWIQIRLEVLSKIVSMIRKYHNHKPKTNPWHREEEPHNHHQTPGRQTKQSKQLSLPHQDDCKTRIDIRPGLKAPEQSDTKIDSSPLVSNSLIQIGLTFQAFVRPPVYSQIGNLLASFLFYVVSIWLNMTST